MDNNNIVQKEDSSANIIATEPKSNIEDKNTVSQATVIDTGKRLTQEAGECLKCRQCSGYSEHSNWR